MPHTTIMKDSEIGDAWIQQMCAANPPGFVIDPATGQPNGNITTGPVRLAFCESLFVPSSGMKGKGGAQVQQSANPRLTYGCAILFPPIVDLSIFQQEWTRVAQSDWPSAWNGYQWSGLDPAFRQQAEKAQHQGFTPGGYFMNVSTMYKPPIVDARFNPIVDPKQVYAGCWAILAVNTYASGKGTPRQGPRFGIQTIMKVADDKSLEGGAADPRQQFAGAKVTPPTAPVAAGFGAQQVPGMPPAMPGAPPASVYGGMPQHPGAHAPPPPYVPPAPAPGYGAPPPAASVQNPEITDPNMRAMYGLPPLPYAPY